MTFAILPHVFIFQANLSGPPSESLLIDPPSGFSETTDPRFCSPKNQVIPPKKILPPPGRQIITGP